MSFQHCPRKSALAAHCGNIETQTETGRYKFPGPGNLQPSDFVCRQPAKRLYGNPEWKFIALAIDIIADDSRCTHSRAATSA